jgi:uncharacterized membrane protein
MEDAAASASPPLPGRPYPPPPRGERPWPAWVSMLACIALQLALPSRITPGPIWLFPAVEAALLAALLLATPAKHEHERRRRFALLLTALISLGNVFSLVLVSHALLYHNAVNGRQLITSGALVWLTNVIIFGLWYWETDRGGPGVRAAGHDLAPDFLYPQMNDDRIEPAGWRPVYVDYLYVSLTNAIAFSPTDTMPLTARAKGMMGLQSLISLVTIALVVSRAVNILQ